MEVLRIVLLIGHFAALAVLLGAFVGQLAAGRVFGAAMVGAAGALLGTGLLLVAVRAADDLSVNGPKIGVKLAIAAAVLGCALVGRRRTATAVAAPVPAGGAVPVSPPAGARSSAVGLFYAAGLLTIANVAVAVAWT
ncbi:hypothetical protein SAMN04489712_102271 [Thermomonospora echinospora]|uniref:Integral membrane protein n=1 Tax=Thermomonospora echinospora TaxID=1992 RepID=A0A1H5VCZ4_9ACTN|nr:hypothetical protein [Thermomonospora echinospora]SEF85222.1 hypothetical protein SAMN04489712_102271 [Thermomonospora echinospora]